MDGVGATIKNGVYRDVMSNKCVINLNKVVNGITSLYLPEPDLLMEPDDTEEAQKIPETLPNYSERFQGRFNLFNPIFHFGC